MNIIKLNDIIMQVYCLYKFYRCSYEKLVENEYEIDEFEKTISDIDNFIKEYYRSYKQTR